MLLIESLTEEKIKIFESYKSELFQICRYKKKVKLVTLVTGDPKAPLSKATTQRCRGGHFSISWIPPLCP